MSTIDMQDLPAFLPDVLKRVEAGEEIGIQRNGTTVATLTPCLKRWAVAAGSSKIGFLEGKLSVPDNFKKIAREGILKMFGEDE